MEWSEVIEHRSLRNLPFKIETNRYGQIVMSPASNQHGLYQAAIIGQILLLKTSGYPQSECAIQTEDGVKVADVAWYTANFRQAHRGELAYTAAPELCVEILSPSNTTTEIDEKTRLYFEHGAQEVWICDEVGTMSFRNQAGELTNSELFPKFPLQIDIE